MFLMLLSLVLAAWAVHTVLLLRRRTEGPRRPNPGELLLRYVLVGYCGVPMLLVAAFLLVHPHETSEILGIEPDHPSTLFLGWAYLGMAAIATLAWRFRGRYLVAPTVVWATFFLGATFVHLGSTVLVGGSGHLGVLGIIATHGFVSALLVGSGLAAILRNL